MTRFILFGKQLTEAEISALKALVSEAGCPADEIAVVNAVDDPDPGVENEIILVLGTSATCADTDIESNLAKAEKGARRAIWIWPQDAAAASLPAGAAKYSYSVIPWNAQKLGVVSADDDITCFETPNGEPFPKVTTERNLCVEEKANVK